MADPQGLFEYPNLRTFIAGDFPLGHGVTPSVATIQLAPQPVDIPAIGNMVISYGSVRITFFDCRIDALNSDLGDDGKETWTIYVMDRRWRWKGLGQVSGYYNVRDADNGGAIIKATEKTPRELAAMCLSALGERGFDVSRMPNLSRPVVEWDYSNPAEELQRLCDDLGCRVVLGLDNRVRVLVLGEGKDLPDGLDVVSAGLSLDPPEKPDAIAAVAGRTRVQVDMLLEAVGLDIDGTIKPIDDLSYAPKSQTATTTLINGGTLPGIATGKKAWELADLPHFHGIADRRLRDLAKSCIYKWYRIKCSKSSPVIMPQPTGRPVPIEVLREVLPIEDVQVRKGQVNPKLAAGNPNAPQFQPKPLPAIVYGLWHDGGEAYTNVVTTVDPTLVEAVVIDPNDTKALDKARMSGRVLRDFEIDTERGIVKFSEPISRYSILQTNIVRRPAILYLRAAVPLRFSKTLAYWHYEVKRNTRGQRTRTEARYDVKDEVSLEVETIYNKNFGIARYVTNEREVRDVLNYYLDQIERQYELDPAGTVKYAGFKAIPPDGAIQQVCWFVGADGLAYTQASANREDAKLSPTFKEKRRQDQQQAAIEWQRRNQLRLAHGKVKQ